MNETIERLFIDFLENNQAGGLSEELRHISAEIDKQIKSGPVEEDIIGDYELAALRLGFYAGFTAALELLAAKVRTAPRERVKREKQHKAA